MWERLMTFWKELQLRLTKITKSSKGQYISESHLAKLRGNTNGDYD